jgi:predicted Holliday junction resolvase-like endonuclease
LTNKQVIESLKKSGLIASCSACDEEFPLSKAILFDGLGKFPDEAETRRQALLLELKERAGQLEKRKASIEKGEKTTVAVGIGKIVEKILPICRNFNLPLSDCRPLFEPIDMVIFNGASKNTVDSITFLEIKTGGARLNDHQKAVKERVENGGISYKEI